MPEPFTMQIRDRTIADLRTRSAPAVSYREQRRRHSRFYVKTTDNALVLRCWGRSRSVGWSLKAVMHPDHAGVRLEGRIRCPGEMLLIGWWSGLAVVTAAVALAGAFSGEPAAAFPLAGAILFLALAVLFIRRRRSEMEERRALAYRYVLTV